MEAQQLSTLIKESIKEALREERLALCLALIPRVTQKEMAEILEQFGTPQDYDADEFVNMTDWVRNGTNPE